MTSTAQRTPATLREEVAAIDWYHTLELAPGVVTPGWLDHRSVLPSIPIPRSLEGKRCLDVGTFNGFWAFEMERRGASEVIGVDVLDPQDWDWPVGSGAETIAAVSERHAGGAGFEIARRELGSSVQRLDRSVYTLSETDIGQFDVIYLGSLLIHLQNPVKALERLRSICRGILIVVDGVDPFLSMAFRRRPVASLDGIGRPWWWYPNSAAQAQMVRSAGFELTDGPRRLNVPPGAGWSQSKFALRGLTNREGRFRLYVAWRGDPHAVLVATPAPTRS